MLHANSIVSVNGLIITVGWISEKKHLTGSHEGLLVYLWKTVHMSFEINA